jgi:lysophospholipase L1-like esterase
MRRWFTALAVWCALAACATPDTAPTTTAEIGIAVPPGASEWFAGHYTERVLLFNEAYAEPMNGGIAFVGDSITEGGDWPTLFPGSTSRNYGIGGDTTVGLNNRLEQVVAARPAKIFLLIATNDLGDDSRDIAQILVNYERLVDRIRRELPDTRLYIQSVLPRESRNASGVLALNQGLRQIAASRNLTYVDIYTPFAVDGGILDPAVTEDDLHLTPAGYARWREVIAPLVQAP